MTHAPRSFPIAMLAALVLALALSNCNGAEGYRCKETMNKYFEIVTSRNYSQLATILTPNVVWTIPGPSGVLPFNGVWHGVKGVLNFFAAINGAISMFYNDEYFEVNTDNEGHVSFHDEGAVVRKNRMFYRAAVAHEWHFDKDCLVTEFTGYYDTATAVQAWNGKMGYSYPIPNIAHPVYGNDQVKPSEAITVVENWIETANTSLLADNITVFIAGNQDVLPFAGVHLDKKSFLDSLFEVSKMFKVVPLQSTAPDMAEKGNVARYDLFGFESVRTGKKTNIRVCRVFRLNLSRQIQQIFYFGDTYPLLQIIA